MDVELAGMNIDYNLINKAKKIISKDKNSYDINPEVFTPETLSAAYARISRSPKSIDELREESINKVNKARKSNKKIVYGMGHGSIAEHATFNIDIKKVSRLASEYIQKHRLVSFTEKSQRYIKLDEDYIIPDEIKDDRDLVEEYENLIKVENKLYNRLYIQLRDYFKNNYPELSKNKIQSKAKEDARYVLSLATTSQMGMTINARNLEYILKRFAVNPLFEIQELGKKLYEEIHPIVPSLIVFNEPEEYDYKKWENNFDINLVENIDDNSYEHVKLLDYTEKGEEKIIAGLLFKKSKYDYENIMNNINNINKKEILKKVWDDIDFYHRMDRVFELANIKFEFILSSSAFAQMKRHRMSTILTGDYDVDLGVTMPGSIKNIGEEDNFMELMDSINDFYYKIKKYDETAANYVLSNAHRKRVIMKANLREWYHFSRLRSDKHAQWEIRAISQAVDNKIKEIYPNVAKLLMGKDKFKEIVRNVK